MIGRAQITRQIEILQNFIESQRGTVEEKARLAAIRLSDDERAELQGLLARESKKLLPPAEDARADELFERHIKNIHKTEEVEIIKTVVRYVVPNEEGEPLYGPVYRVGIKKVREEWVR